MMTIPGLSLLRWTGSGQKHSVRTDAVFCDHLHGVVVVGDHRLFLGILGGWSTAWRV